jgi:predicted TIM-barrel enzyme
VLVVAPALHRTRLRYWVSDSDEAIEHARAVEQQTVHMLRREDVPSSGHVGSSDPVKAIEDALRFFDADRIAIAMHTTGKRRYRERELRAEVERRFGRPVITVEPAAA